MDYKNIITIKFAQAEQPRFEEKRAKGYVEFGGNNNYPEYLIGLFNEKGMLCRKHSTDII